MFCDKYTFLYTSIACIMINYKLTQHFNAISYMTPATQLFFNIIDWDYYKIPKQCLPINVDFLLFY